MRFCKISGETGPLLPRWEEWTMQDRFDTTCPACRQPVTLQFSGGETLSGYELSGFCPCLLAPGDAIETWCEWLDDLESRPPAWWATELDRQQ
jgi:hypothetical protein